MRAGLTILRAGPAMTLQDLGREGYVGQGLSVGGAADRMALFEAAALLGLPAVAPGIEMAGMGGVFRADAPVRFALTGAPMRAILDDVPIGWNMTHHMQAGQELRIGGAQSGVYGYFTPAGGVVAPVWLGSVSAHLTAGIGRLLADGDRLEIGADRGLGAAAQKIAPSARFAGGRVRMMAGPQTGLFAAEVLRRLLAEEFTRSAQANRQGVRLENGGAGFESEAPKGLASEFIICGDIQMTGDGVPFVLMSECQTVGGYPRIGTVLPQDVAIVAQAPLGAKLHFEMVECAAADAAYRSDAALLQGLRASVQAAVRDPHDIVDLLGYQLISGVTLGDDLERERYG